MATILKLTTINVAGMNAPDKRSYIFNHLLQEGHVIALQETHCTNASIKSWEKEWQGTSVWNPYSSRSVGVAILFHPKIEVEILDK